MNLPARLTTFLDKEEHKMFVDGEYVSASSDKKIRVIDSATEKPVGKIRVANAEDVDKAVESAKRTFNSIEWSKMYPADRELLMFRLADLIEQNKEELASLITLENGKLLGDARSSDVMGAVRTFRYYAGWCTKLEGETIDISMRQKMGKQNFAFTRREPKGVIGAIVPWNFPLSIAAWKIAPAIAAGCTVVLKPSEETPLCALYLAELVMEAGFPKGVLNVLTGDGKTTGASLVNHKDIAKITFTGSTATGKAIGKNALDNMTDISLELGGKSPAIVFQDANRKEVAKGIAAGIFRNAGQVCVAGSRVYIQKSNYDEILTDICHVADRMRISHGFDQDAQLGPLVSKNHWKRIDGYIKQGVEDGSTLITGGNNPKSKGYFMKPTIFSCENNQDFVVQEEIFGPVLVAVPFDDIEDALQKANDSRYGLAGTVWTQDINKAMLCINELKAGFLAVNSPVRSDANLPLGGYKQSGFGTELGKVGVYNYTNLKSVNVVY